MFGADDNSNPVLAYDAGRLCNSETLLQIALRLIPGTGYRNEKSIFQDDSPDAAQYPKQGMLFRQSSEGNANDGSFDSRFQTLADD